MTLYKKCIDTKKTLAIIVTYNRLSLLKECIDCLRNQSLNTDILIFDNASDDGTDKWATSQKDIIYIRSNKNLGGAGGFSNGIKIGAELEYDYLWIMDDDCLPKETALESLYKASDEIDNNYGWLSSKCLWTDGELCPMNVQMVSPYRSLKIKDSLNIQEAAMASFVSLFVKTSTVREYGLPIGEFFIWSDDWEYTRRISLKEKCYVVNDSVVIHAMKTKAIVNSATDSDDRMNRYKYFYRNDVYLYRREGLKGWLWIVMKDIYHSIRLILCGKYNRLKIVWNGFNEGIKFNPTIKYLRK